MELVTGPGGRPLKIETFPEPGKGTPASLVESLALAHDRFEPVGQEGADRPAFLGRHDTRLAQKIGIELERDVRLHDDLSLARQLRAAQFYVQAAGSAPK
jgi:hypothetical protein